MVSPSHSRLHELWLVEYKRAGLVSLDGFIPSDVLTTIITAGLSTFPDGLLPPPRLHATLDFSSVFLKGY